MGKNTEIELKLALTDALAWEKLLASPLLNGQTKRKPVRELFEAVYFDTDDQALEKAHLAYRVRREGTRWIATVKDGGTSAGGLHQRREWNAAVEGPAPCLDPFMTGPAGPVLRNAIGEKELLPLFSSRFERVTFDVAAEDGSRIEVAADRGEVVAGTDAPLRSPILEVELELKAGLPAALLNVGAQLAHAFPLLPETRSKYFRGLVLRGLAGENGTPEPKPDLARRQAGEGLERALIHLIHQVIAAQGRFLHQPDAPETIHRLRVELRRLRSLLALSRPLAADSGRCSRFETALCDWAQELGPLREHDVMGFNWKRIATDCLDRKVDDRITPLLTAGRNKESAALIAKLGSGRSTPLLLELWGWLEGRALSDAPESKDRLEIFLGARLRQWLRKMLKAAGKSGLSDPDEIHGIRVKGKKLRYTLEYFNFFFGGAEENLMEKLVVVQNELGHLCDLFYTNQFLSKLLNGQADPEVHRQAGILTGWQKCEMDFLQPRVSEYFRPLRKAARHLFEGRNAGPES